MRSLTRVLALACTCVLACAACSGPSPSPTDAGGAPVDAGVDAALDAAPAGADPEPAALPALTPCPPGWRTVAPASADDPATCDPWPASGRTPCAEDELWVPGDPACMPVGAACSATDDFATDLPAGAVVYYVRPDATAGDGSRALPFGTIAEAAAAAATMPDAVIALSRGRHVLTDVVSLTGPVTVQGACASETTVVGPAPRPVFSPHVAVTVRDVRFEGGSPVMLARDIDLVLRSVVVAGARGLPFSLMNGSMDAVDVIVRGGSTSLFLTNTHATLRRVVLEDAASSALAIDGGDVTVTDMFIRHAGDEAGSTFAIEITAGATVRLERAVLEDCPGSGALVDRGSTFELIDAVVTGRARTLPAGDDGFFALGASVLHLARVRIAQARSYAILIGDVGTRGVLDDVVVSDVLGDMTGSGEGLSVEQGATATVTRMLVTRARSVGILASGVGVALELRDVTVRDTEASPTGEWGRGLQVQLGAHVTGARVGLQRTREAALVVASAGSSAVLTDVDVRDTRERACVASTCAGLGGGIGVGAYIDGALSLSRFRIGTSALTGVQLARGGAVDLRDGQIVSNPVGINVQIPGYDFARLSDHVVFRDNGNNLDSSELPVPAPDTSGLGP